MISREEIKEHIESVLLYMPYETQNLLIHQPSRSPNYYAAFDREGYLVEQFVELDQLVNWLEQEGEIQSESFNGFAAE